MVYISGGNKLIDPEKTLAHLGIEEGMNVAYLGCGSTGHFLIPAAKMIGENGKAYAVDILKSVLSEVSKKSRLEGVSNVKTLWANLEIYRSTGLPDNALDMAFLINILFQSKEHTNIFREAKRILKIGGKLLVIDWNRTAAPFGPPPIDRVKVEDVKSLAHSLGLELVDEFFPGKYHFALIFRK